MEPLDRDRLKLMEARQAGHLEPIFAWLKDRAIKAEKPREPEGPEWPYVRAFRDGEAKSYWEILSWLGGMTTTPDEAQNTED